MGRGSLGISQFRAPREHLKIIYISYIRSVLEQSAVVWHFGLTEKNRHDLERVQKSACKLILRRKYEDYTKALDILDLDNLEKRRNKLCKTFACKAEKNFSIKFEPNHNCHFIDLRQTDKLKVTFCKTERYKNSAIPRMQVLLNENN